MPTDETKTEETKTEGTSSWRDGLTDTQKGVLDLKGFKDAGSLVDSYVNLEKKIGVPPENLLVIPDGKDQEAIDKFKVKLGRPETKEGYDLPFHEKAEDVYKKVMTDTFFEEGVSKDAAKKTIEAINAYSKATAEKKEVEIAKEKDEQTEALKKEWGHKYAANSHNAKLAAASLGISDSQLDSMENAIGVDSTMQILHKFGSKMKEAVLADNKKETNSTANAAKAQLEAIKNDKEFFEKLMDGDVMTTHKYEQLHIAALQ